MMDRLLIFILSITLFACNTESGKKGNAIVEPVKQDHSGHQNNDSDEQLTLNNGAKWKADQSTNENVKVLQDISDTLLTENIKITTDYTNAGIKLQAGIDQLITDCRMEGPEHEALHKWLHPLMEKVENLKSTTSLDEGTKNVAEIKKHLTLYNTFFD